MPLNALTIFACIFLVIGLIADIVSLGCEAKRYFWPDKPSPSPIPMVGFVFYVIACFVGWIYLPWQVAAAVLAGLTLFHLICQFTFFFAGNGNRPQP